MTAAWRRPLAPGRGELLGAGLAAGATVLVGFLASRRLGTAGLLAPAVLIVLAVLVRKPVVVVSTVVGLAVLCEGSTFGLFNFTAHLYDQFYKGLTPLDALVVFAIFTVGLDVMRHRRRVYFPKPLAIGSGMLLLAMIMGAVIGHAAGASVRSVAISENVLAYLLLLPTAIANLDLDRSQVTRLLTGAAVLAIVKAVLGLIEISGGYGTPIEGTARLTYYEPAANWLIMVALLWVVATRVTRVKTPLWMLLGSPLLIASLLLSYRRSFWIGAVLGLLLVIVLGTSASGRRLLLPMGLLVVVAIWLLSSVNFQSQIPVVKRAASLAPSNLETNAEDRYRLDERANVLGAIDEHPITGLGMMIPWSASVRPLPVEHMEGRLYVHFAALWFWLKLGLLGLLAYVSLILGSLLLGRQVWRRSGEHYLRAFGLASLCAIVGLVVIETTASFTGVDPRFTVLLSFQVGLLAQLARTGRPQAKEDDQEAPPPSFAGRLASLPFTPTSDVSEPFVAR
jgi:hypothetical protein